MLTTFPIESGVANSKNPLILMADPPIWLIDETLNVEVVIVWAKRDVKVLVVVILPEISCQSTPLMVDRLMLMVERRGAVTTAVLMLLVLREAAWVVPTPMFNKTSPVTPRFPEARAPKLPAVNWALLPIDEIADTRLAPVIAAVPPIAILLTLESVTKTCWAFVTRP
jgi:hypothetical protein